MFVTSAMHVLVAAAVVVMLLRCGVLGSSLDASLSDDVASLLDRMKTQESLNHDLTTKLLRHEEKLSQQENLIKELTTKLLRHEDNLSQQENLLARQDGTLLQQGSLIQQLRFEVATSRASTNVSRASANVSRASANISLAAAPVSRTSDTVSRASTLEDTEPTSRHVSIVDVMDRPDPETPDSRANAQVSGRIVAKRSDYVHNVEKPSAADHNVVKRSDDGGPLEAVVNQISQRLTEMGAELQALKAQTTSDHNDLKVQTTSDLNALTVQITSDLKALKTETTADVQTLQNRDRQQDQNIHDARTSTFVRWGSSTCGNSSSLVYSGIVGGSWFNDAGAATDYLCLTLSPVPSQHAPPSAYAKLYGAEYDTQDSHHEKDSLCAVCRAAFSTTVMVPGTDTCSPGWHRHYSGFLMAGYYGFKAGSQYICVDPVMESGPHGDANENGKLLYFTVTHCGSLPCGPYVNNKVVTCAVCSM